jgi:hypothetical protein
MGYLLLIVVLFLYQIASYFKLDTILKKTFLYRIPYYAIEFLLLNFSFYLMDGEPSIFTAMFFSLFIFIPALEIKLMYFEKDKE